MGDSVDEQSTVSHRRLIESSVNKNSHNSILQSSYRSRAPRLRWSSELHRLFENAIGSLGGVERATPKMVLQLMNVQGVTMSNIKSHLQVYRSMKKKMGSEVVTGGEMVDGAIANSSGDQSTSGGHDEAAIASNVEVKDDVSLELSLGLC